MGDELFAFLDAIAAKPHEDTPRLAFADWLEDRGDPRAGAVRAGPNSTAATYQFAAELMGRAGAKGDVYEWQRQARRLYHFGGRPAEYAVSREFYERLALFVERQSDELGTDLLDFEGDVVFMRVPVVIRGEEPVGV